MTEREEVIAELRKELEWDEHGDPTFEELRNNNPYFREIFDRLIDERLSSGWREYPKEKPDAGGWYNVTLRTLIVEWAWWDKENGFEDPNGYVIKSVTAFQPLPSPFTKEGT